MEQSSCGNLLRIRTGCGNDISVATVEDGEVLTSQDNQLKGISYGVGRIGDKLFTVPADV